MKRTFMKVTKKKLSNMVLKYYAGGKKIKINDKICSGFVINYSNLKGISPSNQNPDEVSLSLKMFVEKDGMLYELYSKTK